jgi:hypothetical protein
LREWLITLWGAYCEGVKRLSSHFATSQTGDILFAHFKKVKAG